mmetsp:Transcript_104586/g.294716  ORF Transcript_104586/g.294716 Transcript_104586/m.294716 type:complete len:211 (+) Transcript_104586:1493-2125(+)
MVFLAHGLARVVDDLSHDGVQMVLVRPNDTESAHLRKHDDQRDPHDDALGAKDLPHELLEVVEVMNQLDSHDDDEQHCGEHPVRHCADGADLRIEHRADTGLKFGGEAGARRYDLRRRQLSVLLTQDELGVGRALIKGRQLLWRGRDLCDANDNQYHEKQPIFIHPVIHRLHHDGHGGASANEEQGPDNVSRLGVLRHVHRPRLPDEIKQ